MVQWLRRVTHNELEIMLHFFGGGGGGAERQGGGGGGGLSG